MPRVVVESAPVPTSPAPHELPEHFLAWVAGIFDACGTIRVAVTRSGTFVALVVRHRVAGVAPVLVRAFGGRVRETDGAWVASNDAARAFIATVGEHVRTWRGPLAHAFEAFDTRHTAVARRASALAVRALMRERATSPLTRPGRARPTAALASVRAPRDDAPPPPASRVDDAPAPRETAST